MNNSIFLLFLFFIGCTKNFDDKKSFIQKSLDFISFKSTEEKQKDIKETSDILSKILDGIKEKENYSGFFRNDTSEFDAWKEKIKIIYSQSWNIETVSVSSSGLDKLFNTEDDLIKSKNCENYSNMITGFPFWFYIIPVYIAFYVFNHLIIQETNKIDHFLYSEQDNIFWVYYIFIPYFVCFCLINDFFYAKNYVKKRDKRI